MASLTTTAIGRILGAERERAIIQQVYPSDKNLFEEHWSKTFVQNQQSFDLYKSIATTGAGVDDDSGYQDVSQ